MANMVKLFEEAAELLVFIHRRPLARSNLSTTATTATNETSARLLLPATQTDNFISTGRSSLPTAEKCVSYLSKCIRWGIPRADFYKALHEWHMMKCQKDQYCSMCFAYFNLFLCLCLNRFVFHKKTRNKNNFCNNWEKYLSTLSIIYKFNKIRRK